MSVRVLLVDDHPIVRDGIKVVLNNHPDFHVVGETGDGLKVNSLVEALQPDVVVLDLMLPGLGGIEVTRQIRAGGVNTKIVILSMHAAEAYVLEALAAGANAYVLKKSVSAELIEAIIGALKGKRYLGANISEDLLDAYRQLSKKDTPDPYASLTPRERQVIHQVIEGFTNRQIAARLKISPRTVEMHRANLMRKLNLSSTAELVRYALDRGITSPE